MPPHVADRSPDDVSDEAGKQHQIPEEKEVFGSSESPNDWSWDILHLDPLDEKVKANRWRSDEDEEADPNHDVKEELPER